MTHTRSCRAHAAQPRARHPRLRRRRSRSAAQIAIPLPGTPVPLTLQPFVVVLAGLLLGPLDAAGAMVAYLVLGALGAPVFAPMGPPGIARLLSPTGGYLLAYPLAAAVAGWLGARRPRFAQRALAGAGRHRW